MKFNCRLFVCAALLFFLSVSAALAQAPAGALRGQVTDPSGAAITGATAVMTPATGNPVTAQTDSQGFYEFKALAQGKYSLTVVAQGFTLYENDNVVIAAQPLRLNVSMVIEAQQEKLNVSDTAPTIDVNPANNAGAIVISGKELEALPDDPDELQSDLEALAGPSAGPNGGQMYIDGFTAGQLPPKASIREIRINQNPFSAEYDKLGYGRIEIFTKPGTDNYHGQFLVDGNDDIFNSPNPFAGPEPSYDSQLYNASIGGPINKKSSFFFSVDRRNINAVAPINTFVLDPTFTEQVPFIESIPNPHQRWNLGPRFDWAITKNNTLTARYQFFRDTETNNLNSQLYLPSQANYTQSDEHTLQVSDTQVFGTKIVNETRFQFVRDTSLQTPNDTTPAVNVIGNFTGGGSSAGNLNDREYRYEFQNYTSVIHGNHVMKFGLRVRDTHDTNYSTSGFNGTFTFTAMTGANSLQSALQAIQNGTTPYAYQLSYTTGSPNVAVNYYDVEPYFQDDWRVRPNLTLSAGLRYEGQNYLRERGDWAPRFGFAWGVHGRSSPPLVVIRGGYGIFYDRFQTGAILQQERLNGITQNSFIINNPTCFPGIDVPLTTFSGCGAATQSASAIYQVNPRLHAPYTLQGAIGVERQITKSATLSLIYLNSRGFDQFLTINANAPYPGTPGSTVRPNPNAGNIYQYVSEGNFSQNQFIANSNIRISSKVQLFGYYTMNNAYSDAPNVSQAGVASFPSNSYNIKQDYGRAAFDIRQRLFFGGSIALPYMFRLSPMMIVSSGTPFSIYAPTDLNADAQFNDRPGFISNATCPLPVVPNGNIYCTPLGTFDARPDLATTPERIIPINSATGPGHFVMNVRFMKTFGFGRPTKSTGNNPQNQAGGGGGREGGGGHMGGGGGGPRGGPIFGGGPGGMSLSSASDRRYNLAIGVSVRNVFNNVNVANPNSVLGSKLFNVSNSLVGGPFSPGLGGANRRLDLIATFSF